MDDRPGYAYRISVALLPAVRVAWVAFGLGLVLFVVTMIDHGRMDAPLALAVALILLQMAAPFVGGFGFCREFVDGSTKPVRKRWLVASGAALSAGGTFLLLRGAISRAVPPVEEWAPILLCTVATALVLRASRVTRVRGAGRRRPMGTTTHDLDASVMTAL